MSQNKNGVINTTLWKRCSNSVFCCKLKLIPCVTNCFPVEYSGRGIGKILQNIGVKDPGQEIMKGLRIGNIKSKNSNKMQTEKTNNAEKGRN